MSEKPGMTQTEMVRNRIEEEIALGHMRPGERVDEESFALLCQTSRTPVREAVMQLVAAGLLTKRPRQGAVVAAPDLEQMLQLFDYAAEMAGLCAKFSARRLRPAELDRLNELHKEMGTMAQAEAFAEYADAAAEFHHLIISASRNTYLIESTLKVVSQLARYFRYELTFPGQMLKDHEGHAELLAALVHRDSDQACQLMRQHAMLKPEVIGDYIAFLAADPHQKAEQESYNP